jgi:hypothetical protein
MSEPKPIQEGTTKSNKKNYKPRTRRKAQPPKAIISKPLPKEYEDIVLRFKPTITNNINKKLFDMGYNQKYFGMKIEMLDPTGVVFETWLMTGCQIKSVDLGTFDYSNSSLSECEVVISCGDYMIK